jgi:hypothetical protein
MLGDADCFLLQGKGTAGAALGRNGVGCASRSLILCVINQSGASEGVQG